MSFYLLSSFPKVTVGLSLNSSKILFSQTKQLHSSWCLQYTCVSLHHLWTCLNLLVFPILTFEEQIFLCIYIRCIHSLHKMGRALWLVSVYSFEITMLFLPISPFPWEETKEKVCQEGFWYWMKSIINFPRIEKVKHWGSVSFFGKWQCCHLRTGT